MPPSRARSAAADARHPLNPSGPQRPRLLVVLVVLAALTATPGAVPRTHAATPALPPETQSVLVEAVTAAAALDFYNARCRADDSGRHSDNLNKQLVGKLRLTIVTVEDAFFPEKNYRTAQQRLVEDAAERLRQAGGCKGAKETGLPETLNTRYRKAVEAIEALP